MSRMASRAISARVVVSAAMRSSLRPSSCAVASVRSRMLSTDPKKGQSEDDLNRLLDDFEKELDHEAASVAAGRAASSRSVASSTSSASSSSTTTTSSTPSTSNEHLSFAARPRGTGDRVLPEDIPDELRLTDEQFDRLGDEELAKLLDDAESSMNDKLRLDVFKQFDPSPVEVADTFGSFSRGASTSSNSNVDNDNLGLLGPTPPSLESLSDISVGPNKNAALAPPGARGTKIPCPFCVPDTTPDRRMQLEYTNLELLHKFINSRGMILPRRATHVCAKHQRQLALEVKRARAIGLLSYTSAWKVGPEYAV